MRILWREITAKMFNHKKEREKLKFKIKNDFTIAHGSKSTFGSF
jgi:hypothetical protein